MAGGVGFIQSNSRPTRSDVTAFSLVVVTKSKYFSRLSKKRNGWSENFIVATQFHNSARIIFWTGMYFKGTFFTNLHL
jgi:hypothetical protein